MAYKAWTKTEKQKKINVLVNVAGCIPVLLFCAVFMYGGENQISNIIHSTGTILAVLIVLACIGLAALLQIAAHEIGHLVFGFITGYSWISFRAFVGSKGWPD